MGPLIVALIFSISLFYNTFSVSLLKCQRKTNRKIVISIMRAKKEEKKKNMKRKQHNRSMCLVN